MYSKKGIGLVVVALLAAQAVPARGQAINEDLKILANDGGADNHFGYSIAIDQGIIAVGAPNDDDNGANSGSAYLFDANTGLQLAKLTPDDGAAGDQFGFSIAINGDVVAVGAPGDDHNGITSGSAYLFDASTGAQLAKLTPGNAAAGDEFGNSIAIDAGIIAIGAWRDDELDEDAGAAYLFDASTGAQLDKLLPDTGGRYQSFGVSIAMDDGVVVIGARTYFVLGKGYTFAKAYLFDVVTGNQLNVLQADIENYNGDLGGHFGDAVDIDNGIVAVGAWSRSIFFDHSGAAYLFDAASGSQLAFIFPGDGHDRDHFGNSISIDNGVVAIGAHQDGDNGWVAGSAYIFDANSGNQVDKLLASDGAQFDYFGSSIAIDNGIIGIGAIGDEDNGSDSGSAYLFDMNPAEIALADSVNVVLGGSITGQLSDVDVSDDVDFCVKHGNAASPFSPSLILEFDATLPNDSPDSLKVVLETQVNDTPNTQQVAMFNFVTNSYEVIDTSPSPTTDTVFNIPLTGDITRFVEPGTGTIRTKLSYSSSPTAIGLGWRCCIDQLIWEHN